MNTVRYVCEYTSNKYSVDFIIKQGQSPKSLAIYPVFSKSVNFNVATDGKLHEEERLVEDTSIDRVRICIVFS